MMDIGAYNIPTDQLAMVHKNELIMPAPQASAFRSMLESGGAGGGGQGGRQDLERQLLLEAEILTWATPLRRPARPWSPP